MASPAQYDCKRDIWNLGILLRDLSCSSESALALSTGPLKEDCDARRAADGVVLLAYKLSKTSAKAKKCVLFCPAADVKRLAAMSA